MSSPDVPALESSALDEPPMHDEPPMDDESASAEEAEEPPLTFDADDDWRRAVGNLRHNVRQRAAAGQQHMDSYDDDDGPAEEVGDEEELDDMYRRRATRSSRRCWYYVATALVSIGLVCAWQLWMWLHPTPVRCDLELVRPQKFKIDVTDFFAPRVSAALQLVLSVRNGNLLRSMLLEQCKLTAYETETGLKLGSTQQGSLVISPLSTTKVTSTSPLRAAPFPHTGP